MRNHWDSAWKQGKGPLAMTRMLGACLLTCHGVIKCMSVCRWRWWGQAGLPLQVGPYGQCQRWWDAGGAQQQGGNGLVVEISCCQVKGNSWIGPSVLFFGCKWTAHGMCMLLPEQVKDLSTKDFDGGGWRDWSLRSDAPGQHYRHIVIKAIDKNEWKSLLSRIAM